MCVTKWTQKGVTVAGGHNNGSAQNQLSFPQGLYVDDNQTILVADSFNHRIMEWELGATTGRVVAGGNGGGNRTDQFNLPSTVIVDNETDSLIICDPLNWRVMRWPRHGGTNGTTLIENIACTGLATDDRGFLYISDWKKQEVRRYRMGETDGKLVAGGNGLGDGPHQFASPHYVFVDRDYSVYVADSNNHRVMKWVQNATRGIPVAGDAGIGRDLIQLAHPRGLLVDQLGTVYVAEYGNNRVSQWCNGTKQGAISVGGNGAGNQAKQLNFPDGLALDRHGNLYVSDSRNHRVQRFSIKPS